MSGYLPRTFKACRCASVSDKPKFDSSFSIFDHASSTLSSSRSSSTSNQDHQIQSYPYPQTSSFPSLTSLRITQLLNALSILFPNYIYLVQARRPRLQEGRYCQGRAQNGHVSTRTVHQNKSIIYKLRSHVLSSLAINLVTLVYLVLLKNLVPSNRFYRF